MRYGPNVPRNVLSCGGEDEVCTRREKLQRQLGKTVTVVNDLGPQLACKTGHSHVNYLMFNYPSASICEQRLDYCVDTGDHQCCQDSDAGNDSTEGMLYDYHFKYSYKERFPFKV